MTRSILLLVIVGFAAGCDDSPRPPSKPKKRASASAATVTNGAPQAQVTPVAPTAPVAPIPPAMTAAPARSSAAPATVVREEVKPPKPVMKFASTSDTWHTDEEKAANDAILVAQMELMKRLQSLDSPIYTKPSLARIRREYVKNRTVMYPTAEQEAKLRENGLTDKRLQVTIDVELTEAQVLSLRAGDRVTDGLRGAGLLFAFVAAAYGFFRLDAWSKGYLTTWLGIGAVLSIAGALAIVLS